MISGGKSTRYCGRLGPLRQRGFILVGKGRAMLGKPFNVADLFRAGEQGYWYENTLDSLYQDSTGITPAYAPGQGAADCPIGLRLDKRFGLARGAEFFSDANVTLLGEATRVSPGVYRIYSSAGASSGINTTAVTPLVVGSSYEVSFNIDSIAAVGSGVRVDGGGAAFTTTGPHSCRFTATSSGANILRVAGTTDIQISAVSYKKIPGNHASQSVAGSRPTLSARYNKALASEDFTNASWSKSGCTVVGSKLIEGAAGTFHNVAQAGVTTSGASNTVVVRAKAVERSWIWIQVGTLSAYYNLANGTLGSVSGGSTSAIAASPGGYYDCTMVVANPTSTAFNIGLATADATPSYSGDGASGVLLARADNRLTDDAAKLIPAYQSVTNANTYDTAGFPWYLKTDGFDDGMVTNTIDFTGTDKMTVWAGVTKLSDASIALPIELTVDTSANNGGFYVRAPAAASPSYGFASRGTVGQSARTATTYAAPISNVISVRYDNAALTISAQAVPQINGVSPTLADGSPTGAGNFANAPIYLFRRGGTSNPFNGRDYGQIVRGAASTASQIANAERYLARNMGLSF